MTSSKRSSISASPILGSTPTDWFASRSARHRSLAGTVTPEEPEVYPFELEAPAISYKSHVHGNTGTHKWYFDPDGIDPGHSDADSTSLDFRVVRASAGTGQEATANLAQANWILAAMEPIVADLALRESRFRREEPLREEFRECVAKFVVLLAKRERKSKKDAVVGQCWRTVCTSQMRPMMADMRGMV